MVKPFQFKEFAVLQDKAAMKIGTDAVLLGAWCAVADTIDSVLDIGAGTGVLSLMMAQRSNAVLIDAVEVDVHAYEQCVGNFENSQWADRLFCYHTSFSDYVDEMQSEDEKYDLIISNPPFYTEAYESENSSRNRARFISSLPFNDLIFGVSKLLSEQGEFSVVIPFKEEIEFEKLANHYGLYAIRKCHVKGNATSEIKRSLLTFCFQEETCFNENLIVETSRHNYTKEYINLTKNFYLNM